MSESTNMELWDDWATPDPAFCKEASNGKYSFTNIDAYWIIREATRRWGMMGKTWGLDPDCVEWQAIVIDPVGLLIFKGVFYYPGGRFPISVDQRLKAGDDVCKKLMTNAISKSLSYLGLGASVYLGNFDDAKFMADAAVQWGDKKAFMETALGSIRIAKTLAAVDVIEKRVLGLVAKKTISSALGEELTNEIALRRVSLSVTKDRE